MRTLLGWAMAVVFLLTTLWQHHRSHQNWLEAQRWKAAYYSLKYPGVTPKPIYIPEQNDYVCAPGWTPAGAWGENGVPLNPYRPIGCKLEAK